MYMKNFEIYSLHYVYYIQGYNFNRKTLVENVGTQKFNNMLMSKFIVGIQHVNKNGIGLKSYEHLPVKLLPTLFGKFIPVGTYGNLL